MIVPCPACHRSYRLEDSRLRPGRRLRCTACGHLFERHEAANEAPPTPSRARARPSSASAGTGPLVLLADGGRPFRTVIHPLLEGLGCRVELAAQGAEAFRLAVAQRPALLIASVHLAELSGVAICEGVKGSPHLRDIKVALVGSALSADLFNRDTALAYGADLFLDERMSRDVLLREISSALQGGAAAGADREASEPPPEDPPDGASGPEAEIGRLARLMLSDLRLYNPDRFERALLDGKLLESFRDELSKGRDLVDQRFPEVKARQEVLAAALRQGIETAGSELSSSGRRTG